MSGAVSAVGTAALNAGLISVGTASTIAGAASSLSTISTVASLVGTGLSAVSSINQGKAASNAAEYNARLATENARRAGITGEIETGNKQMENRAKAGAMIASQAAKGIDVNTGSAVDVQTSQAQLGQLNALTIRSKAAQEAYGYQSSAALSEAEAKNDSAAGIIGAGATAASGLGKLGMEYSDWNAKRNGL